MIVQNHQRPTMKKPCDFRKMLVQLHFSQSTIRVYLSAVYTYYNIYRELNAKNLDGFKIYLENHYSPRTANLYIIGINRYLKYLGKPELQLHTKRLRHQNYLDGILSYEDYKRLKVLLKKDDNQKWMFIIWTLAATGVRVSELLQFKIGHISRGYIDIQSKGDKQRRVYIPKKLQIKLLEWTDQREDNNGPLFLNDKGQQISIRGISKGLERIALRYGLDKHLMHPHAFRHLFAKKFLETKGDISMLADLLGHESLDTTKIYLRMTSAEQQRIIDEVVNW